jgi:hypothetical protein
VVGVADGLGLRVGLGVLVGRGVLVGPGPGVGEGAAAETSMPHELISKVINRKAGKSNPYLFILYFLSYLIHKRTNFIVSLVYEQGMTIKIATRDLKHILQVICFQVSLK